MMLVILAMGFILAIAFRIVLGWVLPRAAALAFDNFVYEAYKLVFKLGVVAMAGGIIWLFYAAAQNSP